MKVYRVKILCKNCLHRQEVEISLGQEVSTWLKLNKNDICPNCRCSRSLR